MAACSSDEAPARPNRTILDETLFRGVLSRERERSDRSNQPLGLLTVQQYGSSSIALDKAIDALASTTRKTDIIGWLEGRTLGVLLPELRASQLSTMSDRMETRFRRKLATLLDADALGELSFMFRAYPEPTRSEGSGSSPADTILYPHRSKRRLQSRRYDAIKRVLDIVVSLTSLIGLSPLLLLIAALLKIGSSGPIVFKQERIGYAMKPFTMFKFRTMYSGKDDKIHRDYVRSFITARGQVDQSAHNGVFKLSADSRVTRIGALLRKTSLDELPQLWNVLRGDMSLVGPRPPLAYEVEQYDAWHRHRILDAKPGITGLWQVTGRSRTTFDEMVRLDLRYARTRSLWIDIKILLATPAAVLSGKGAC